MATNQITSDLNLKRDSKPQAKAFTLNDGDGLGLLVKPNGAKWWRFNYTIHNTRKTISFGVYPQVSLSQARVQAVKARELVANGIDPSTQRKQQKQAIKQQQEVKKLVDAGLPLPDSFEAVAREWHQKQAAKWTALYAKETLTRLTRNVFPWLMNKPIGEVTAKELLAIFRRIEERGAIETAHKVKQLCGQVFRYAIVTRDAVERDPTADLRGALVPVNEKHHPSITHIQQIGELLRAIDGYQGHFVTRCALQLAPLVFTRPGELRQAEWAEIDFNAKEWRIPADKMKMRAIHIVPLSTQAIAILQEIQPLTGMGRYVFPSIRTHTRPMSNNTILSALRRLGYAKAEMSGHGFRSMASTRLNELGWNRDAIERQLAHAERDNVRAAYNYADYLPERRKMMQAWADHLDELKRGAAILHFKQVG